MKIALVSNVTPGTGNNTTARRIEGHLLSAGHEVGVVSTKLDDGQIRAQLEASGFDAALGLHAFGAGRHLRERELPFGIIFGGTDINEDVKDAGRLGVMSEAVARARGLVAFSEEFLSRARSLWPAAADKLWEIPQGVQTAPANFSIRDHLTLPADSQILLLPAGLRAVKDPYFLVECVADWHARNPRIHLVIAGERRDAAFAESFERMTEDKRGVVFAGSLPQSELHAAMLDSAAVLNTSLSECTPNSLLEAMCLGAPVLARDIPGNAAIVAPGRTGMLFTTPQEFVALAERLIEDEELRAEMTRNAREYIEARHSLDAERSSYQKFAALLS